MHVRACVRACVIVRVHVRAFVRAYMCVRAFVRACMLFGTQFIRAYGAVGDCMRIRRVPSGNTPPWARV